MQRFMKVNVLTAVERPRWIVSPTMLSAEWWWIGSRGRKLLKTKSVICTWACGVFLLQSCHISVTGEQIPMSSRVFLSEAVPAVGGICWKKASDYHTRRNSTCRWLQIVCCWRDSDGKDCWLYVCIDHCWEYILTDKLPADQLRYPILHFSFRTSAPMSSEQQRASRRSHGNVNRNAQWLAVDQGCCGLLWSWYRVHTVGPLSDGPRFCSHLLFGPRNSARWIFWIRSRTGRQFLLVNIFCPVGRSIQV